MTTPDAAPQTGETYFDKEIQAQLRITSISDQEIQYDILPSPEFPQGGDGMATPLYFTKLIKQKKVNFIEKE